MISKRLRLIASLISNQQSVLDIGCDHGYLAQQLRLNGNNELIICADNKLGPLNNARKNLVGVENVEFVLSDGAGEVSKQVDVAVCAGMGYQTVTEILRASESYFRKCDYLIIQVNNSVDKMRQWLSGHDYMITDEEVIKDYKYYQILIVKNGQQQLNELQISFGPVLLEKRSDTFLEYLNYQIEKNRKIMKGIDPENPDYQQLEQRNRIMENIINKDSH